MRRIALALVTAAVAASGIGAACQNPAPTPTPPVPPSTVYAELVDGGCYRANDAGLYWVTQEANRPNQPAWMICLREGGTVAGCGVPCARSGDQ